MKERRNLPPVLRFQPCRAWLSFARRLLTPMKIPENIRPFLVPTAWLATAALTFGLGRISSFVDAPPESQTVPGTPAAAAGAADGVDFVSAGASARVLGSGSRAATTVQELTGGKPVDEWLKRLLAQDDEAARTTGFMMLLEKLNTAEEIEAALVTVHASMRNDWGGRSSREAAMLLQKWTKLDAKSAMAYVQKIEDPRSKFGGMNTVLQTWARSSPQEAVAWAKENGVKATPDFGGGGGGREQGNWAMTSVLSQLAKTDLGQALELAQAEPVSNARGRVIETLVGQLVSQRGEAGARDAALAIADESMRASMIRQLAGRAAESDPAKAIEWVSTLPAGAAKTSALTETVRQWAQKDSTAAAAYVKTLPAGAETDGPRATVARYVVDKDPAGAIAWSNSITDPAARTESLGNVVGSWMRNDAEAAKQWVNQLPEETKAQVMAAAAQRGGGGPGGNRGGGRRAP